MTLRPSSTARSTRQALLFAAAALAAAATLAGGCATKKTVVDPTFRTPEGVPAGANAPLIAWPSVPDTVLLIKSRDPADETSIDTVLAIEPHYRTPAGAIEGLILDNTSASAYQLFRRELNGGVRQFKDFVFNPTRRWLDSRWESFAFVDSAPSGFTPPSYVGRGLVAGLVTAASPLTTLGEASVTPAATITYLATHQPRPPFDDSLFTMEWTPVAGAAGYWLQVYQFRSDIREEERIQSGAPSPLFLGKSRDTFIGYVPAPTTRYKIGTPGAIVLTKRNPLCDVEYLVRIAAVGPNGELLAVSRGLDSLGFGNPTYRTYQVNATKVKPSRTRGT